MADGRVDEKRQQRGRGRDSRTSRRSRSFSRSSSVSSRSNRSRSRSRSRAKSSRSRGSAQRHRRHRSQSRSRSASRHGHSKRRRHSASRSRSRSRERRGHHSSSNRKRSRREDSRERSCSRRRRRDSREEGASRHARRRASQDEEKEVKTTTERVEALKTSESTEATHEEHKEEDTDADGDVAMTESHGNKPSVVVPVEEKATLPVVTTEADVASTIEEATKPVFQVNEPDDGKNKAKPATVDVSSIKMDILKALAEARSTIAVIKGDTQVKMEEKVPETSEVVETRQPAEEAPVVAVLVPDVKMVESPKRSKSRSPVKRSSPMKEVVAADVDEFDMFAAAEMHDGAVLMSPMGPSVSAAAAATVQSNFDDADGYYKPSVGEILNGKYRVSGAVGKGVFSTVLRCHRVGDNASDESNAVAIKLIRNNEIMREAAQTEVKILTELAEKDPRDKKHCVRLLDRFEHRNHVALVFESMQMNVREAMKKFGGKGGISLQAVRIFAKHLLIAISHLDMCEIVHADIKPDNVLLDDKQTMIKLCDFGSAFKLDEGKHDPTPYLVSRFYRAPEIVLGLPYDKAVDMWSVGCCLYEMFTGKVMFPGSTNNEMLKLFMELKGKIPNKLIKKHRQAYIDQFLMEPHFTEDNKFCSRELDRVTAKPVLRLMDVIKTKMDLGSALLSAKSSTDDRKLVLELRNLLERMFTLDPAKRITPKEALAHPFVKNEGKQGH